MASRRCCCGTVLEVCEGCCSDCMTSHTLERKGRWLSSGSPFGIPGDTENPQGHADPIMPQVPGDEIILTHGARVVEVSGKKRLAGELVRKSYRNIGSFWTWYTPPFMVDFSHNFPSCTTLNGGGRPGSYPNAILRSCFIPLESDEVTGSDTLGLKCHPVNRTVETTEDADEQQFYCAHAEGSPYGQGPPKFDIISEYEPYDAYPANGSSPIFNPLATPDAVKFKVGGALSYRYGYPCSTQEEDKCCRLDLGADTSITGVNLSELHINGIFGPVQNKPNACNYLGLTRYRRRMLKNYYPWAYQIFSYALDNLMPFGNPTYHWGEEIVVSEEGGDSERKLVAVGHNLNTSSGVPLGLYLNSLRFQFMGFAFCEHHYDGKCGCTEFSDDFNDNIILSRFIPRRFIFGCSGIPMFEFDIYEAIKDGKLAESEIESEQGAAPKFIQNWKSFTVWFENPKRRGDVVVTEEVETNVNVLGGVPIANTPTLGEVDAVRNIMNELTRNKYDGLRSTDWRYRATLDIIEANTLYKEAIAKRKLLVDPTDTSEVVFDIIQAVGSYSFTIDDVIGNPEQYSRIIFPKPLGPVRKRCRMINAPVANRPWNDDGAGNLVSLTSIYGPNVLVPRSFSLTGQTPVPLVDSDYIDLQAIKWFDIGKPYREAQSSGVHGIPKFNGTLENPDPVNYPDINWNERDIATDLNYKLSHLMHTYFMTQPSGWDYCAWGALPNGPKPENSWWFRKYATTPGGAGSVGQLFATVNPHSLISKFTNGVFEYSWNPNSTGWSE